MNRKRQSKDLSYGNLEPRCLLAADFGAMNADALLLGEQAGQDCEAYSSLNSQTADGAGNSFGSAKNVGQLEGKQQFSDRVDASDRRDFYRFEIDRTGEVSISLNGLSADADIYLFNQQGRILEFSYNGGDESESIERRLEAGTYYVLVVPYDGAASDYQLTLDAQLDAPDEAGNSPSQARDVGVLNESKTFEDRVDRSDTVDFYRFQLDQVSDVSIQLDRLRSDVDLYLFDSNGRLLAQSFRGGNQSESISARLESGTYIVMVEPWNGAESSYRLSLGADAITPADPEQPDSEQPDSEQPAPEQPPADPDPNTGTQPLPDVANYGGQRDWNLNRVNAPEAWARGYTGQNVVVAVIDTGVDRQHSDLSSNIWRNQGETAGDGIDNDGNGFVDDVFGWNFVGNNANTQDGNGHGTHVAGTIAALRNNTGATGVAYGSQIMPVRVLGNDGSGSSDGVANGIRYAADNGADIINLSLGGTFNHLIQSALEYARQLGVFVVVASGNSSAPVPSFPARHSATNNGVLSVGAHDQNNQQAYFSNRVGSSGAQQVDAPGVGIYSTLPGNQYGNLNGTSMAAPHVAGVAALALSANPNLTPAQLRQLILDGANRSISGSDSSGGVNAATTVAMALDATSPSGAPSLGQAASAPGEIAMTSGPSTISMSATNLGRADSVGNLDGRVSPEITPAYYSDVSLELQTETLDQVFAEHHGLELVALDTTTISDSNLILASADGAIGSSEESIFTLLNEVDAELLDDKSSVKVLRSLV